jgi:hypothetical protein
MPIIRSQVHPPSTAPDWQAFDEWQWKHVHDWRRYVGEDVRRIWDTFSDEQKEAIAKNAQEVANKEDWD